MTDLIISTWGWSYKRVTSDMTVLIIGTWGRSVYMTYPKY
jgi:hypothetical protein